MSYLQKVIRPDETVRHWGRLHRIIYLPGATFMAIGIVCTIAIISGGMSPFYATGGLLGIFIGPIALIGAWFKFKTTEVVVTDRRIILKTGWLARRTIEMNMDKVESVDVMRSLLGRIMDYGTILVRGTGTGTEPLATIAAPLDLRNSITVR